MTRHWKYTAALQILALIAAGCSMDDGTSDASKTEAARSPVATEERALAVPASDAYGPDASADGTLTALETSPARQAPEAEAAAVDDGIDHAAAGRQAWEAGDYATAAEQLAQAVARDQAESYDVYLLGLAMWKEGRLDEAEGVLEDACWKLEDFPRASVNLARVRVEKGDLEGARSAIDAALEIDENFAPARNVLGRILLLQGDRDGAFEAFRKAAELDPSNPWPLNNMGYAKLVTGQGAEAVSDLEQAVARNESIALFWSNLALAREQAGDLSGAAAAAEKAAALETSEPAYQKTHDRLAALLTATEAVETVADATKEPEPVIAQVTEPEEHP